MTVVSFSANEIKANLLTLSFPKELEQAFLDDYFEKSLRHVRIALLLGFFFYGIFGILDAWLVPDVKETLWLIRYAIFFPFLLGVFLFSYSIHFKKFMQLSIAGVILVAGLGIIAMILIAPDPGSYLYYAGLILIFLFGYTFFKLRFIWATVTGWTLVIAYEISAIWLTQTPIPILINNNFFFLAGNVIGMFACYSIEFYSRKDFIQARQLQAEKKKVTDANRELEERVEERTAQLTRTNEELRQEIEERRRAQEALHESQKRYRDLFEQSRDPIFINSREGKLIDVNQSFLDLLGYTKSEIGNLKSQETYANPDDRSRFQHEIEQKGSATDFELKLRKKDGTEIDCLLTATVRKAEDGAILGYQGIIRDITEHKRAEEERKKLEVQLARAQRMEAMGTLAGGVAHDFNNILAAIVGYVELSMLDVVEDTKVKHNLEEVLRAGKRAKDLVNQILAFSRQSRNELKPVEITPVVKEALKLLRASLPTTIEIRHHVEPDTGTIEADPTQIHQVLMNLCTNAAHAMSEEGGLLEVSVTKVAIDASAAPLNLDIDSGPYLKMSVRDTGHGMTSKVLERIFDPYFTTKEKGKGTGLGLAVVHGIVKSHKGGIGVESEPGSGTCFHVYFPRIEQKKELTDTETVQPFPTGHECVLFVDDEQDLVQIAAQMLSHLGYEVTTRMSSNEALELFRVNPERFDLVITDMTMPNMTGDTLSKELMKIRRDIPIILCTGFSERISEEKAKAIGIKEFVMKPLAMGDLAKRVRKVLDNERF
ncbi:MAG TPA: PAS domain S-box protein [Desulfatiglandales bacterium]|nr:PAS domain S-box protein [Desulfatiglandales bacterium]